MELKMEINQKQILSQHMVQSMEILQMSAQELEAYIENLAVENPVIEFPDIHSEQTDAAQMELQRRLDWLESADWQNKVYYQQERTSHSIEDRWHDFYESEETLSEYLLSQLLLADYSGSERAVIEFLIFSLDSRGYFMDEILSVADRLKVPGQMVQKLLGDLQALEPAGVGTRDLKECLLLQIDRKKVEYEIVRSVIKNHLGDLAKNHLAEIAKKLHITMDEVLKACEIIRSLNPKPGNFFNNRERFCYVIPDAVVVKMGEQFDVILNQSRHPDFTINNYYREMIRYTKDTETKKYLHEKIQQAQWVSNCIKQRTSIFSKIMRILLEIQYDFFCCGIGSKRPMKLSDLADELGVHESTVSRAMRGKYLQCSFGIFPLNYFLTSAAAKTSDGEEVKTPEQIKALIQEIVDHEDRKKPYSDQAISKKLEQYHIKISRRTVNKYRTEMGLPDKSGRKMWTD